MSEELRDINIIHLDRLDLTLNHLKSSSFSNERNPNNIKERQVFNNIELEIDYYKGSQAYFFTWKVYCKGYYVGRLHTGNKRQVNLIEFNFDKAVLYAFSEVYWYEVYNSICSELGFQYNNIKYVEIAVDSTIDLVSIYGHLYTNSVNFKYRKNGYFSNVGNPNVRIEKGGNSFGVDGSSCSVSLYEKSSHAEEFIMKFFKRNGFNDRKVYRIESRIKWNYIKSIINRKKIIITPETLLQKEFLFQLFKISSSNKLLFMDLRTKYFDHNKNKKHKSISILDYIDMETCELPHVYNTELRLNHYKGDTVNVEIVKRLYYQYIETGNEDFLKEIKNIAFTTRISDSTLHKLIRNFNYKYKGDRRYDKVKRMNFALNHYKEWNRYKPIFIQIIFENVINHSKNILSRWKGFVLMFGCN